MRALVAILLALVLAVPGHALTRKIQFTFHSRRELSDLEATGAYEIVEVQGNRATALHTMDAALTGEAPALREMSVVEGDVDQELATFRARGSVGAYHTPESAYAELKALADQYPQLCKLESIGKTFEGRDMWCLRITGAPDTTKVPRMLIFGLIHAREWISAELPFVVIRKLLNGYATDPAMKTLVDGHAFWIMPVTNPDGLAFSQNGMTMWRKNRSKRQGVREIGVDVNRNFEVGWGAGSSGQPGSDVYRGPAFNSELETQALLALVQREKFHVTLSFHSYSELILYPWGYTEADPPGKDVLSAHGQAMAALNHYSPGSVAQILYTAGGATDDTFFAKCGAWSWTFELATQFIPSDSEIKPICEQNWPAVLHLMQATGELAAKPPPSSPASVAAEKLARLEGAYRDARIAPLVSAPGGDLLTDMVAAISAQLPSDTVLKGEVERRAGDLVLRKLYAPLLQQ